MKEITPFLHASLYHHERIETFGQLEAALSPWMLTKEHMQRMSTLLMPREENVAICETPVMDMSAHEKQHSKSEIAVHAHANAEPPKKVPDVSKNRRKVIVDLRTVEEPDEKVGEKEHACPQTTTRFAPRKPDSLFWSLFIAHNGVSEFSQIGNKYMNREMEEKTRIMEFLGANRALLKSMKITAATGQEMMGDLMTNKQTTLFMVPAFAMYYKTRIWVVSEESKTYYEFAPHAGDTTDSPVYVLYRNKGSHKFANYAAEVQVTPEILEQLRGQLLLLDTVAKPLKGVSSYKLPELEEMVDKLGVKLPDGKLKKGDVYAALIKHCEIAWM